MPIFSTTSHVQITSGNFIEIGGDFNLQSFQPPGSVNEVLTGLNFSLDQNSGRQLLAAERADRGGDPRMLSAGASEELPLCSS